MIRTRYILFPFFILLVITYSNYFNNVFEFDDSHAIIDNPAIRSLKNPLRFFTDPATFSTLPDHQERRPLLTLSFAIDYFIAGNYSNLIFRTSSFCYFIALGVLIYNFLILFLKDGQRDRYDSITALFTTFFFLLHPVSAAVVNYTVQRGEVLATFWIIAAIFTALKAKNWKMYLLAILFEVLALASKQTGVVVGPLLFICLFKYSSNLIKNLKIFSPFIFTGALIYVFYLNTGHYVSGVSRYNYLITQPLVILTYLKNFILPTGLSLDTDLMPFNSIWDLQFFIPLLILFTLTSFAVIGLLRGSIIAIGFLWFLIALLPTSSIFPLDEVMNNHRMFLPFIGLLISLSAILKKILSFNLRQEIPRLFLISGLFFVISIYAVEAHRINNIWKSSLLIWEETVKISPRNGRAQMNYGLALMALGDYVGAEQAFSIAEKFVPTYSILHVNMGVLFDALGEQDKAEMHFKKAFDLTNGDSTSRFYFGRYYLNKANLPAAITMLSGFRENERNNPIHVSLLGMAYFLNGEVEKANQVKTNFFNIYPELKDSLTLSYFDFENLKSTYLKSFTDLAVAAYNKKNFQACIDVGEIILRIDPKNSKGLSNQSICYAGLGKFMIALPFAEKAVELDPALSIARNNLNWIKSELQTQK